MTGVEEANRESKHDEYEKVVAICDEQTGIHYEEGYAGKWCDFFQERCVVYRRIYPEQLYQGVCSCVRRHDWVKNREEKEG